MKGLVRRLRGALGLGVAWSVVWIAMGVVVFAAISILRPQDIDPGEGLTTALPILAFVGFLAGLGFAILLSLTERRSTFGDLSLTRVALWGLLGAAAIPSLIGADPTNGWTTGPMGAISALATLSIARRGAPRPAEERTPA